MRLGAIAESEVATPTKLTSEWKHHFILPFGRGQLHPPLWVMTVSSSMFVLFWFGAPGIINLALDMWHVMKMLCAPTCNHLHVEHTPLEPCTANAFVHNIWTPNADHKGRNRPRASTLAHSQWWARNGCKAATRSTLLWATNRSDVYIVWPKRSKTKPQFLRHRASRWVGYTSKMYGYRTSNESSSVASLSANASHIGAACEQTWGPQARNEQLHVSELCWMHRIQTSRRMTSRHNMTQPCHTFVYIRLTQYGNCTDHQ